MHTKDTVNKQNEKILILTLNLRLICKTFLVEAVHSVESME